MNRATTITIGLTGLAVVGLSGCANNVADDGADDAAKPAASATVTVTSTTTTTASAASTSWAARGRSGLWVARP